MKLRVVFGVIVALSITTAGAEYPGAAGSTQANLNLRQVFGTSFIHSDDPSIKEGPDLMKHVIDPSDFPDAECNDLSRPVFYYRPFQEAANRNRWVIQLMGGGFCFDALDCEQRWRGQAPLMPVFDADNMTSLNLPARGLAGGGIMDRTQSTNPFAQWNHILIHYCSSDAWTGSSHEPVDLINPVTGEPTGVQIQLPFLGRVIFNAAIDTLRRCHDGQPVTPLIYVNDTKPRQPRAMPDLDDADAVMLVGDSAGGAGVVNNLDHLHQMLLHHDAGGCTARQDTTPPRVGGLLDSAFGPSAETLDLTQSLPCERGQGCHWQEQMHYSVTQGTDFMRRSRLDASCLSFHAADRHPGHCADVMHVLLNHVTTPFFVRMGQSDELLSRLYAESTTLTSESDPTVSVTIPGLDFRVPTPNPRSHSMTVEEFAALVRRQARLLATIKDTAEERGDIGVVPGAFVPACSQHDTLRGPLVYNTTIHDGTSDLALFDVIRAWARHQDAILISRGPNDSNCH